MKKFLKFIIWGAVTIIVLVLTLLFIAESGMPLLSDTEITQEKPFAEFIGREYRLKTELKAQAWNDFHDKTKILTVTLVPVNRARNRFVSYEVLVSKGQRIQIIKASKHFALIENAYHYSVLVPGVDLPARVPIKISIADDGIPDPSIYEPVSE